MNLWPCRLFLSVVALLAAACAPAVHTAGPHEFSAPGRPDYSVRVDPELTLAAADTLWGNVTSDVSAAPRASFSYAVFGEDGSGPVRRHAHTLVSTVQGRDWRFALETKGTADLAYEKSRSQGRFWTVRTHIVPGAGDWFTRLWAANGREVPEYWLARRWSFTTDARTRVAAEYREPVPACMDEALAASAARGDWRRVPRLDGAQIRSLCARELDDFARRADAVFAFGRSSASTPGRAAGFLPVRPDGLPDLDLLVGEAEQVGRDAPDYKD